MSPVPETTAGSEARSDDTLARLAAVIESRHPRAGGDPATSYVARLFSKGPDAILKKVGEEATEVVMACKDGDRPRIVGEVADLWFHSMVALAAYGFVATFQSDPNFGRVLAAYGGVFVVGSLVWGVVADGFEPDRYDLVGAAICLVGVAVIMYAPRAAS